MKQLTIWTVVAAIALIPLGWLAMRNLRSLLIGAWLLGVALVFFGGAVVVAIVVLGALAVLNLYLMKGPASQRLIWTLRSTLIWTFVLCVMYVAERQVNEVRRADRSGLSARTATGWRDAQDRNLHDCRV